MDLFTSIPVLVGAALVEFDRKLDIGNVLTSVTILISLGALLITLAKDRRARDRELGDRVRSAAAKTLGKLERWHQLSARFYQDVQPLFVDVSQKLHAEVDAEAARDLLWRGMTTARTAAEQRIVDEEIESAYVELYPYHPTVQRQFAETMTRLKRIDEAVYSQFIEQTQQDVLAYKGDPKDYRPALLGNDLRLRSAEAEHRLVTDLEKATEPIRHFLVGVVSLTDKAIVSRAVLPSEAPAPRG